MKKLIIVVAALILLSGCASVGNQRLHGESSVTAAQKMTEGETTKAQVRHLYGGPDNIIFTDSGMEQWKYQLTFAENDGKNFIPFYGLFKGKVYTRTTQLVILFDDNDVIKKFTMSVSTGEQRVGLFQ